MYHSHNDYHTLQTLYEITAPITILGKMNLCIMNACQEANYKVHVGLTHRVGTKFKWE